MSDLLSITDLTMTIDDHHILNKVSIDVADGECVALVGESGSGKSMTAKTVLAMQPKRAHLTGSVTVNGIEVVDRPAKQIRTVRTEHVSMIYQNPRSGLNPMRRIGAFIVEGVVDAGSMNRTDAHAKAVELMKAVRLRDPDKLFDRYPHELSGGMLQRVMIVGALMNDPKLLLCDEPTTALDVTTQAEVIAILSELQQNRGLGMLFITHDLDLAASISSRTCVMYKGEIVEEGQSDTILEYPSHPYTSALINARPTLDGSRDVRLVSVAQRMAEVEAQGVAA